MKTNIISKSIKTATLVLCLMGLSGFAQKNESSLITKEYPVGSFNKIKVGSDFNVILTKGIQPLVKYEASEEMQNNFKAEVKDNQLTFESTKKTRKTQKHTIYVTYNELVEVDASGASDVKTDSTEIKADKFYLETSGASNVKLNINVNELTTKASGASDVKLAGTAAIHNLKISGAADLKAYKLITQTTIADVSGAASARINSKNKISGEVSGAGSILYADEPLEKNINTSGAGSYKKSNSTSDSTKVGIGNSKITIVDDETGNNIAEVDYDEDDKIDKKGKRIRKFNGIWAGCELGFNGYMDQKYSTKLADEYKFLELNTGKSMAFSLNIFELNANIVNNHFGTTTGLGFTWNNYKFANSTVLVNDSAKIFGYKDVPTLHKTKLTTTFITLPVLLGYQTGGKHGNSFKINTGVIFSYKLNSYTKRVTADDKKIKSHGEYHIEPIKCEATLRVGWKYFKVYANYSLTEMFKKNEGPKVYPFNVGVVLLSL